MIYIDDALNKIIQKLPTKNTKSHFNKVLMPYVSRVEDERE